MSLLNKTYTYNISTIEKDFFLEKLLTKSRVNDYSNFQFKQKKSENILVYRYLISSRAGAIYVILKKEGRTLKVEVKEGLWGFSMPSVFFLLSLCAFIREVNNVGFICLGTGLLFFALIFFAFLYYANEIQLKIKKALKE